jgi:hypothetical protein
MRASAFGEWVVPLPPTPEPIRSVRGTLIVTSRAQIRTFGRYDEYERALPPDSRQHLDAVIASSWVPVDLVHDHLGAIDSLGLSEDVILNGAMGVAEKLHGIFLSTFVKTVRASGMGPLAGAPVIAKIWARIFEGGAIGLQQTGPKDSRLAIRGNVLLKHRYHRIAIRNHYKMGIQVFTRVAHIREDACDPARGLLDLAASWV